MRLAIVAAAALAASSVLFAGNTAHADGLDDKKIVVGGDAQFLLPLTSDFSNASGPWIGVLVHGGYRLTPALELTARAGYLAGLSKSASQSVAGQTFSASYSISDIPVWVGARYYLMNAPAGLYGAAEIGFNFMSVSYSAGGQSASSGATREGFNIGAGYVISPDLPIDIRVQLSYLNLLGTNSGESADLGLGISAGYSFFF
jgi:hypothetical protein